MRRGLLTHRGVVGVINPDKLTSCYYGTTKSMGMTLMTLFGPAISLSTRF